MSQEAVSGAMSPTNPMGPATVVAVAHRSVTTMRLRPRTRPTQVPRAAATSSPRAMLSRAPASRTAAPVPATTRAATGSKGMSVRVREPTSQSMKVRNRFGIVRTTPRMTAPAKAEKATPMSTRRTGEDVEPPIMPMTWTSAVAVRAPPAARSSWPGTGSTPSTAVPRTMPSEAPALTPSSPGSASGLRVTACITAPATPRAVPTSTPRMVRCTRRTWML